MTVSEVLSPDFVDNLVKQDDGFRVLRNLRGSPPLLGANKERCICYDQAVR